jgi:hypothetical protein
VSEERSFGASFCRREFTRKRSEQAIIIVCVLHIPEMMIHTILEGAYETETKAVNLINHAKVEITLQMCDVMEASE